MTDVLVLGAVHLCQGMVLGVAGCWFNGEVEVVKPSAAPGLMQRFAAAIERIGNSLLRLFPVLSG